VGSAPAVVSKAAGAIVARVLLAIVGLSLVAYLLHKTGTERVAHVIWQARGWLPVVLALEAWQLGSDFVALRVILRDRWRSVPAATWLRSSALAYAMMVMLPAGRAAGEVTRAALLAKTLGAPRAATTSTQMQAAYLSANGFLSLVEFTFIGSFFGYGSTLALLVAGNVVFQAFISTSLLAVLWDARVGRRLDGLRMRFVPGAVAHPPTDPAIRRQVPWRAFLVCALSRSMQALQYGVVLHAVGGVFSAHSALVGHSVHLVGATLGDLMPNQMGVVDGMYRAFSTDLGFAGDPARALSIAFVIRISQLTLAALCVVAASVTRQAGPAAAPASQAPAGADVRS
jgi:hypothetical protein